MCDAHHSALDVMSVKEGRRKATEVNRIEHEKGAVTAMETVMSGFEKHAAFYRAYLPEERSFVPLTVALATIVALWLLVYLVASVGPEPQHRAQPAAAKGAAVVETITR